MLEIQVGMRRGNEKRVLANPEKRAFNLRVDKGITPNESSTGQTGIQPWRLRYGRDKFLRPWLFIFIVGLYATIYVVVAILMFFLNWLVPHLPWIPKPYVSPDPPPLVTAFYCANLVLGFLAVMVPAVYILGPQRQIRPLWPKKNAKAKP